MQDRSCIDAEPIKILGPYRRTWDARDRRCMPEKRSRQQSDEARRMRFEGSAVLAQPTQACGSIAQAQICIN